MAEVRTRNNATYLSKFGQNNSDIVQREDGQDFSKLHAEEDRARARILLLEPKWLRPVVVVGQKRFATGGPNYNRRMAHVIVGEPFRLCTLPLPAAGPIRPLH